MYMLLLLLLSHFNHVWLCDSIDDSPPGSPVPGILQARTLEWVAIAFSSALKWKVKVKSLSHVRLFATPWTTAYQAPPSMGVSRQEYWSGVPLPSPCICYMYLYFKYIIDIYIFKYKCIFIWHINYTYLYKFLGVGVCILLVLFLW